MGNDFLIHQFEYMNDTGKPRKHRHLFSELMYVQSGTLLFVVDGKTYTAGSGSLLFANSYELHEGFIQEKPFRCFFLSLDSSKLEQSLNNELLISVFQNRTSSFTHQVDLSQNYDEIYEMFDRMLMEFEAQKPLSDVMMRNLLENLLVLVYRTCPGNFIQSDPAVFRFVSEIRMYIEQHFTEEIRVAELAKRYSISPGYFSHVFKDQIGYSPKQYMLLNRLSYARELLEAKELQVSQVASRAGFGDVSNFIRSFREWYGLSPGSYRSRSI